MREVFLIAVYVAAYFESKSLHRESQHESMCKMARGKKRVSCCEAGICIVSKRDISFLNKQKMFGKFKIK